MESWGAPTQTDMGQPTPTTVRTPLEWPVFGQNLVQGHMIDDDQGKLFSFLRRASWPFATAWVQREGIVLREEAGTTLWPHPTAGKPAQKTE